jgi:hypothetical protein
MKIASFFYALALVTLPAGPATKLLLGREDLIWIDPALIFSALAFVALLPEWRRKDLQNLTGVVCAILVLTLLSVACAGSGFLFRPVDKLYDPLREPLRLFLELIWFLTSAWFLRFRPVLVLRWAAVAALLGLLSGVFVYLVAFGLIPAPAPMIAYSGEYLLRQTIWYGDIPIPRMGGLFVEAPPFGLFMFGLGVVFCTALRSGRYRTIALIGVVFSFAGALASLADQVVPAVVLCVGAAVLSVSTRPAWLKPLMLTAAAGILIIAGAVSLKEKITSETGAANASSIYRNSVGERNFHLHYGLSLLQQQPRATLFGIGPGRYGEYVADTGYFPDTVTMQYTVPEILVEWGVAGLAVWIFIAAATARKVCVLNGLAGTGMLLALLLADSFQANWKCETVFLAVAALCTPAFAPMRGRPFRAMLPIRPAGLSEGREASSA